MECPQIASDQGNLSAKINSYSGPPTLKLLKVILSLLLLGLDVDLEDAAHLGENTLYEHAS